MKPPAEPVDVSAPVASQRADDGRHLSIPRVIGAVVLAAAAGTGLWTYLDNSVGPASAVAPPSWFAPYVDVTATPQYAFENPEVTGSSNAVLGFVVSAPDEACEPSWGAAYSMAGASEELDLDRRVARLRQLGGEITVSFGGAANEELSIGCTNTSELTDAYQSVVDRYAARIIDLDIEGTAASTPAAAERRALAIAAVTESAAAAGEPLEVWLTLAVGPSGLNDDGLVVLEAMLAAEIELAGVNGMTMNYGETLPDGQSMADAGEVALTALQQQIMTVYAAAGTTLSDADSWHRVGATAMIGQNDTPTEVFGLEDADQLVEFARLNDLPRLSMWSANRDQWCGPNYPNVGIVSDTCSGVQQSAGDFGAILSDLGGEVSATPTATSRTVPAPSESSTADDPATSPYAIWAADTAYPRLTKIVWHRNVYEAKWYTVGDQPDTPVASADETPWTLIGPVLPGEHPAPVITLPAGTYPEWLASEVYEGGARVQLGTVGYQAKWWTQGDVPGSPDASPADSPWQALTPS